MEINDPYACGGQHMACMAHSSVAVRCYDATRELVSSMA
jgi:hypothetical protein